jgi:energy-coupling factor transport system permease protein
MNPKLKLLILVLTTSSLLVFPNIVLIAAITVFSVTLLIAKGLHEKYLIWSKTIAIIMLVIIALQSFTYSGAGFSMAGFWFGAMIAMRFLAFLTLVTIFVHITSTSELKDAFSFLPYTISEVLFLALVLLPKMAMLLENIVNAQKSRCLNFRSPNIFRTYFPILVPLFGKALAQSERMALAMEARGWGND